jgi:TolB-like protein
MVGLAVIAFVALAWWGWNRPVATTGPIRSIAVLPLVNLSGDTSQDYFAAGLTEVLIGDLASISSLGVLSHTSVMRYAGERKLLPVIAEELGVDAIIEGSVQRADDSVRITVQLIDARTDLHLWSQSYERELRDVLRLQREVARAIARAVRLELDPVGPEPLAEPASVNPEAYEAYLKGSFFLKKQGAANHTAAVELLKKAVTLDPEYAPAWARLADGYT